MSIIISITINTNYNECYKSVINTLYNNYYKILLINKSDYKNFPVHWTFLGT